MKSTDIEIAVSALINFRVNVIVPNVSWGLGLNHECDVLVLDSKNRFTEIEIKISKSDLMRDLKKIHGHRSKYISRLAFAVPFELVETCEKVLDKSVGIIVVKAISKGVGTYYEATWYRQCRHNKFSEKVPEKMIRKFFELGCMRIWTLKRHLKQKQKQILTDTEEV